MKQVTQDWSLNLPCDVDLMGQMGASLSWARGSGDRGFGVPVSFIHGAAGRGRAVRGVVALTAAAVSHS